MNPNASGETIEETLVTPVVDSCDVLIIGGGPAGISAALAAARASTKEQPIDVLIVEVSGRESQTAPMVLFVVPYLPTFGSFLMP